MEKYITIICVAYSVPLVLIAIWLYLRISRLCTEKEQPKSQSEKLHEISPMIVGKPTETQKQLESALTESYMFGGPFGGFRCFRSSYFYPPSDDDVPYSLRPPSRNDL